MLQQMLVAEMLLLEARAEDDDAKTKGKALPDLEERPFDWWSPGLVGVSGLLSSHAFSQGFNHAKCN